MKPHGPRLLLALALLGATALAGCTEPGEQEALPPEPEQDAQPDDNRTGPQGEPQGNTTGPDEEELQPRLVAP